MVVIVLRKWEALSQDCLSGPWGHVEPGVIASPIPAALPSLQGVQLRGECFEDDLSHHGRPQPVQGGGAPCSLQLFSSSEQAVLIVGNPKMLQRSLRPRASKLIPVGSTGPVAGTGIVWEESGREEGRTSGRSSDLSRWESRGEHQGAEKVPAISRSSQGLAAEGPGHRLMAIQTRGGAQGAGPSSGCCLRSRCVLTWPHVVLPSATGGLAVSPAGPFTLCTHSPFLLHPRPGASGF